MSGWFGKLKGMFGSQVSDAVPDIIEEQVTAERIDGVLDKIPGGEMVRDHVPEDTGQQIGGATRGFLGGDEKPAGN